MMSTSSPKQAHGSQGVEGKSFLRGCVWSGASQQHQGASTCYGFKAIGSLNYSRE